jgi:6-methylsalicylate decarboxylase
MRIQRDRIDVHHHVIPPALVEAMTSRGIPDVGGVPLPKWTAATSIEVMDANGIQTAITSLSAPGVYFGNLSEACALARRCNEFSADIATRYPGRFGSFAVLPMPFVEPSCAEATYALDVLRADGVVLLGSTEGVFLGDPSLDELMAELDRREAVVFVHPNLHSTSRTLGLDMPGFLVEFVCDTTRAAANLIFSGRAEKYPRIKWILAHAGGFLPYVAWRLSVVNAIVPYSKYTPQEVLSYIKRFYYETALSPSPYALSALRELVDPSHILFGSDFPFAPSIVTAMQVQELERTTIFDAATKFGIGRGHALSLFPAYRAKNEAVAPRPPHHHEPFGAWIERALTRPVVALADRLRRR